MVESYTPHMVEQENSQKSYANVNCHHVMGKEREFASGKKRIERSAAERQPKSEPG
jgi:hypothetical protein